MTIKKYNSYRIAIVILLSASISISISNQNFFLPVAAIAIAMIVLHMMRRRVDGVLADERDYSLAGTSARYAISIFSVLMVAAMFLFMYLGQNNPTLMDISTVLAYLVCVLMLINSAVFYFLKLKMRNGKINSKESLKAALPFIVLVVFVGLLFAAGSMRIFSPEDGWICQNGEWTQHGHPDSPMPNYDCQK